MMIISSKAHQLCGSQPTETLPVGAVSSLLALKKGPIHDAQCYAFTILFTCQRQAAFRSLIIHRNSDRAPPSWS